MGSKKRKDRSGRDDRDGNDLERVPSMTRWPGNWRECLLRARDELGFLVTMAGGGPLDTNDWRLYWIARDAFYTAQKEAESRLKLGIISQTEVDEWAAELGQCEQYLDYLVYAPSVADTHGCGGKHEE